MHRTCLWHNLVANDVAANICHQLQTPHLQNKLQPGYPQRASGLTCKLTIALEKLEMTVLSKSGEKAKPRLNVSKLSPTTNRSHFVLMDVKYCTTGVSSTNAL